MPFDANGVYQQVEGATTAAAGDVIRSATWDSIHLDMGNCLTQLGQLSANSAVMQPRTINAAGSITATATDSTIIIQSSVPVLNLPLSSTRTIPLKIMGGSTGIFSANPCVLTPAGADTISGLATVTLHSDYQVITLYPLGSGGYIID